MDSIDRKVDPSDTWNLVSKPNFVHRAPLDNMNLYTDLEVANPNGELSIFTLIIKEVEELKDSSPAVKRYRAFDQIITGGSVQCDFVLNELEHTQIVTITAQPKDA